MTLDLKEDKSSPFKEADINHAITSINRQQTIIDKIMLLLNERRDAYNGILDSIVYIIRCKDERFIQRLIDALQANIVYKPMPYGGKMFLAKVLYRLTKQEPTFVLSLFEQIIEQSDCWSKDFGHNERELLELEITCIKAIRQAEETPSSRPTKLARCQIDQLCDQAIYKCNDRTKIQTLSLVLESRSTTKVLDERELELYGILFRDAIKLQEPTSRQTFLAITNKLLIRIVSGHKLLMRDKKKFTNEQRIEITSRYGKFLKWLVDHCLDSTYCNAYFGSFIVTVSTMKFITKHLADSYEYWPDIKVTLSSKRCYDSILCCINDSFEENKNLALDLILSLPPNEEFICDMNIKNLETTAYDLVASVNPAHSLTCQYIFRLVIGLESKLKDLKKNQLLLRHLTNLINIVQKSVTETQENFVKALKSEPIYPKLTCIRALLNDVDIQDLEVNRSDWETLAKKVVSISIDACRAVSTIVCNLNPETIGHLPMDLKPVDVDALTKNLNVSLNISESDLNTITSQMLLISGWKTIKECSLSLGAICQRFWWPKELIKDDKFPGLKTDSILNNEAIVEIIDFFDHYMRNLRHRGAFEQAYNGFIMVTQRVWHDVTFRELLTKRLEEIMNDFKEVVCDDKKVGYLKAYVTRRSAGLPFIVQAILIAEHKHDSKTLRWIMDNLFIVLETNKAETYQKIHCLNILKALIREHRLGEKVLPYVGKTFVVTMDSLRSDSFPIRNCGNMLLKAIVDRTFGISRLRDNIHRRNQLTFEKFFNECPGLHAKMLSHLNDALVNQECLITIHSVFIVLFRLLPGLNPSDHVKNNIIVPFIEPILRLVYNCPDLKLRDLAAQLTIRLKVFCLNENAFCLEEDPYGLVNIIFNRFDQNFNKLHGALSLTKYLVDSCDTISQSHIIDFAREVIEEVLVHSKPIPTITKTLLDIEEICQIKDHDSSVECALNFQKKISSQINIGRVESAFDRLQSENFVFKSITVLLMSYRGKSSIHNFNELLDLSITMIKNEPNKICSTDLQAALIRFFRQHMFGFVDFVDEVIELMDIDFTATHMTPFDKLKIMSENDLDRAEYLRYCQNTALQDYLKSEINIDDIISLHDYKEFRIDPERKTFSKRQSNTPRSVELLAIACKYLDIRDNFDETIHVQHLRFFMNFSTELSSNCDVKCLTILYMGKIFYKLISRDLTDWLDVFYEYSILIENLSENNNSLTIRNTCAEVLRLNMKTIISSGNKQYHRALMHLINALMKLCQDEDLQLRSFSQNILVDLRDCSESSGNAISGSKLDNLIEIITTQLFDPKVGQDVNRCVILLLRFILNSSRDYSEDIEEEKERLFDKTKLNTFADHVAIINSSLMGLKTFLGSSKLKVSNLQLPKDIIEELDSFSQSEVVEFRGDYSSNQHFSDKEDAQSSLLTLDNKQIFEKFFEILQNSLNYFQNGYKHLLIDTEYTYHELSLFKAVVIARFIHEFTDYTSTIAAQDDPIYSIRDKLNSIITKSCSTTLLQKCFELTKAI